MTTQIHSEACKEFHMPTKNKNKLVENIKGSIYSTYFIMLVMCRLEDNIKMS